jgi:hypothetical protein
VVISSANRELGSRTELCPVDDVLRASQPVPAGETVALQQRVGGSTERNSVIAGCESHTAAVQPID